MQMSAAGKPGVLTSEFWLTVFVAIVGGVGPIVVDIYGTAGGTDGTAGGEAMPTWATVTVRLSGLVVAALAALGYQAGRVRLKAGA